MLNYIIILLTINIAITFITGLTDWPATLKKLISRLLTKGKVSTDKWEAHLIDCELCQVFHLSWIFTLIYCLTIGTFNPIMIILICLNAYFTDIMRDILILIKDILMKINRILYKILKLND